tara:strand:- start:688 stop:1965 length:1278 start_codon:yes stop_codon:yes gene_type:complete
MERPTLSICIPTWDRSELLAELLDSLGFVVDLPFSVEILVCNNASEDDTVAIVERYRDRLPLTCSQQATNLGPARNTIGAFRGARGLLSVYLADDDRLVPEALERYVQYLLENPGVVVLHAPWFLEQEDGGGYLSYQVDHPAVFDQSGALGCLDFLLKRKALPEIAIYRTEVLHNILYYPASVYVGFVMLFRAFAHGSVCFHPEPFYRSLVRASGGVKSGSMGQLGHRQAATDLDPYRGSIELALLSALKDVVPLPTPPQMLSAALQMINQFQLDRLEVAVKLSLARRDFIAANEFMHRSLVWREQVNPAEVQSWEDQHLLMMALQSVVELQQGHSMLGPLLLCDLERPQGVVEALASFDDTLAVRVSSVAEVLDDEDLDQHLFFVEGEGARQQLAGAGVPPGRLLFLPDILDQFRVLPRSFSGN